MVRNRDAAELDAAFRLKRELDATGSIEVLMLGVTLRAFEIEGDKLVVFRNAELVGRFDLHRCPDNLSEAEQLQPNEREMLADAIENNRERERSLVKELDARMKALKAVEDTTRPTADQLYQMGTLFHVHGDLDGALAMYERALEANPAHGLASLEAGPLRLARGDTTTAIQHLERARDATLPRHRRGEPLHLLAMLRKDRGQIAQAKALLDQAIAAAPSNPTFQMSMGIMLDELGQRDAGLQALRTAIYGFTPSDQQAQRTATTRAARILCESRGDAQAAVYLLEAQIARDPLALNDLDLADVLATAYGAAGRPSKAREMSHRVAEVAGWARAKTDPAIAAERARAIVTEPRRPSAKLVSTVLIGLCLLLLTVWLAAR